LRRPHGDYEIKDLSQRFCSHSAGVFKLHWWLWLACFCLFSKSKNDICFFVLHSKNRFFRTKIQV